jgi:hypothetical protein
LVLVLDDAHDEEQVRSLLPASPGCLVLITSRHRMTALAEAEPVTLIELPLEHAVTLFRRLASAADAQRDVIEALV